VRKISAGGIPASRVASQRTLGGWFAKWLDEGPVVGEKRIHILDEIAACSEANQNGLRTPPVLKARYPVLGARLFVCLQWFYGYF
tara:strand:- start:24683 stop:24937 length:255 start_codon:yes stop_codon:yes gene_type:complete